MKRLALYLMTVLAASTACAETITVQLADDKNWKVGFVADELFPDDAVCMVGWVTDDRQFIFAMAKKGETMMRIANPKWHFSVDMPMTSVIIDGLLVPVKRGDDHALGVTKEMSRTGGSVEHILNHFLNDEGDRTVELQGTNDLPWVIPSPTSVVRKAFSKCKDRLEQ